MVGGCNQEAGRSGRPPTIMDAIFNYPILYRVKMTLVKTFVRPISRMVIRNAVDIDRFFLDGVSDGARVYEIGCGDGNTFRLFQQAGKKVDYWASDYNEHMVAHCKSRYPEAHWENYSGGLYDHPQDSFDVCIIRGVLHHISAYEDIVLTLAEAARIARRVLLYEPLQSDHQALAVIKSLYWRVTDGGVNYMSLDQLHGVQKAAGVDIVREQMTAPLRQVYAAELLRIVA